MLVKLGLDSSQFEMGIKRAQSAGDKFGSSLKSSITSKIGGALSIAAVTGFAHSVSKAADDISDLSEQLNVSTDNVQRLQILAGETGVAFEKFSSVLSKVEEARIKATAGDADSIKTFKALGLSIEDLRNPQISNLDLSIKIAEAYKESGRSAETTAALIELYGIKLKIAGASLAEFQSISDRGLISEKAIIDLAKANALLEESQRLLQVKATPAITGLLDYFRNFIDQYNDTIEKANESMTKTTYYNIRGLDAALVAGYLAKAIAPFHAFGMGAMGIKPKSKAKEGGPNFNLPEIAPPAISTSRPSIGRSLLKPEATKFSLGGAQDPLARIGGFGAFSSGQSEMIRQALEQKRYLQGIDKNTEKMARELSNA